MGKYKYGIFGFEETSILLTRTDDFNTPALKPTDNFLKGLVPVNNFTGLLVFCAKTGNAKARNKIRKTIRFLKICAFFRAFRLFTEFCYIYRIIHDT